MSSFRRNRRWSEAGKSSINRRLSGEFAIAGRVNSARVTFLFDTGASAVVLTADDARRAGVETSRLVFDVPVATANGAAMAAETRLDQIAVGPIVMRNVPAMVARRGALDESLLGMSFLERLKSYTVERDRLDSGGEVSRLFSRRDEAPLALHAGDGVAQHLEPGAALHGFGRENLPIGAGARPAGKQAVQDAGCNRAGARRAEARARSPA